MVAKTINPRDIWNPPYVVLDLFLKKISVKAVYLS